MSNDAMVNKIQALLAKAESTNSEHEAEMFRAKAFELAAKYGMENALETTPENPDVVQMREFVIKGQYLLRRAMLLNVIVKALNGKAIRMGGSKGQELMFVYAYSRDLDMIDMLWKSLDLQLASAVRNAYVPYGTNARTFRTSFITAFASAVGLRLQEIYNRQKVEAANSVPGAALVLVTREENVENAYRVAHPKVRTTVVRTGYNSGYDAGKTAGNRARLGGTGIGGGRAALGR